MMQMLIFVPHKEQSFIALWQPHAAREWQVYPATVDYTQANDAYATLQELLAREHLSLKQITHVGVMHGPETYMRLRSFVTAANTLAWALKVPLFSFDPDTALPDALPELVTRATVNRPVEPVYPPSSVA